MMASVDQHSDSWGQVSVPIVPTLLSEEQFENWMLANREVRAEWVNGKVIVISPVSHVHNAISIWMTHLISAFLELRPQGELLGPEFMVRLAGVKSRRVPDLLFVASNRCELIKQTYLDGPPDLAIEIVSQDSPARDWREKYLEYEASGVREYWIVDPLSNRIEANRLGASALREGGKFSRIDETDGKIASVVLEGFFLRNDWLWATPRPTVGGVLKEMGIG